MRDVPAKAAVALFCCCRAGVVVEMERRHCWQRSERRRKACSSDILLYSSGLNDREMEVEVTSNAELNGNAKNTI